MNKRNKYPYQHFVSRTNWLRAAVLGANDGIISVSSLMVGVAAASMSADQVLVTGIAGLVAGAMSMAAGEYVSVSSQSDLEKADLEREREELKAFPKAELRELADIYVKRGVEADLALEVAKQMMAKDALAAHARDELGISETMTAKPLEAAIASAASFSFGAIFPIMFVLLLPQELFLVVSSLLCILLLGILGALAANVSGAPIFKPVIRILVWGTAALFFTKFIGSRFGV